MGQWIAKKEENGTIHTINHITRTEPLEAAKYNKIAS